MRGALFLIIVGLGGAAILIALGTWQVQRLAWKQGVIADIDARIVAEPVALPDTPDPVRDAYLPVKVNGLIGHQYLRVLVSEKERGAGYRIIAGLRTDNRTKQETLLVDLGFVPVETSFSDWTVGRKHTPDVYVGNLQWPDEIDSFTPEPDLEENIWFARDVPAMANALSTQPILLVVRDTSRENPIATPMPVDTTRIPNNHLQYAITWFSLAFIWLAMALYFVRRRRA